LAAFFIYWVWTKSAISGLPSIILRFTQGHIAVIVVVRVEVVRQRIAVGVELRTGRQGVVAIGIHAFIYGQNAVAVIVWA